MTAPIRPELDCAGSHPELERADGHPELECAGGHPELECAGGHCVTCADEADEMTVLAVDTARGLALCDGGDGRHRTVETALVDPPAAGDRLLVHAGTAIARLP